MHQTKQKYKYKIEIKTKTFEYNLQLSQRDHNFSCVGLVKKQWVLQLVGCRCCVMIMAIYLGSQTWPKNRFLLEMCRNHLNNMTVYVNTAISQFGVSNGIEQRCRENAFTTHAIYRKQIVLLSTKAACEYCIL